MIVICCYQIIGLSFERGLEPSPPANFNTSSMFTMLKSSSTECFKQHESYKFFAPFLPVYILNVRCKYLHRTTLVLNKVIEKFKSLQISMFHICFLIKCRKRDNNPLNTSVKTIPKKLDL